MLIVSDANQLGDGKLSTHEQLLKKFEDTDVMLNRYRFDDHDHLKDVEARLGQQMTHTDLVYKVTKLNPRIWAEDSINDKNVVGFYTLDAEGNKKYLVAFEKGFLPEFSYILTDAADLPIKEKRGWRTVLVRLLKSKVLTWKQIMLIFGDTHGKASRRWEIETQRYRNQ